MAKKIISGFQSSGRLTLGNYLGAIKPAIKLQEEFALYIFIADLHSLTNPTFTPKELRKSRRQLLNAFQKAGFDKKRSKIFFQSHVPQHSFLGWIISTHTTLGELNRMTQFKDKLAKTTKGQNEYIPTGLLIYPALMAADILLYNSDFVVVGADQTQHIELTRKIAVRFNNKYGETFTVPQAYITPESQRIMSLQEPTKKMSKSDKKTEATIYLDDIPQIAYKKIQKAVTDSEGKVYASEDKPGVTNLLNIYVALKGCDLKAAEEEFKNKNYAEFKHEVGKVVEDFLIDFQKQEEGNLNQEDYQQTIEALKREADETIEIVKKRIGLD